MNFSCFKNPCKVCAKFNICADAEERSKDCPIKLVEEDQIGSAMHHQATIGETDDDHAEKRAEDESKKPTSYENGLADMNYCTAEEPIITIFKTVSR